MSYIIQELCHEIGLLKQALAEKDQQYQQLMAQALEIATEFTDKMSAHGEWDDGCFYYNKYASPELQGLIGVVQAFLKEHQP